MIHDVIIINLPSDFTKNDILFFFWGESISSNAAWRNPSLSADLWRGYALDGAGCGTRRFVLSSRASRSSSPLSSLNFRCWVVDYANGNRALRSWLKCVINNRFMVVNQTQFVLTTAIKYNSNLIQIQFKYS